MCRGGGVARSETAHDSGAATQCINDVIVINALRAAALRGVRVLVLFQFCYLELDSDTITDELQNLARTSNAVVRRTHVHGKVIIINNNLVYLGSSKGVLSHGTLYTIFYHCIPLCIPLIKIF